MNKNILFALIIFLSSFACFAQNKVNSVRIWAAPEHTRVVFDLKKTPDFNYFSLKPSKPYGHRLVIDFKSTASAVKLAQVANKSKLIKAIRVSKPAQASHYRVVLDLVAALKAQVFALKPTKPYGHRLVIDLQTQAKKDVQVQSHSVIPENRDIIVAIDAGHGGEDPGSIGLRGTHEKKVALEISRRLYKLINKTPGMKAKMIRSGDYYINLHYRSEKARKLKADLLLSIHADAVFNRKPKGASVWILSTRRANSEIGRWLEQKEKHSDLLGGAAQAMGSTDSERYLARTLLDMSMDNSRTVSHGVASQIANHLARVTTMHKRRPVSASLAVLKSPDIPSVLIETGFISNPTEERLLNSPRHQKKLAQAIHKAVLSFYLAHPVPGTYLALGSSTKHHVRSGESLSVIAQRYGVSLTQLKKANRLKKNNLKIGQVLIIPRV
tara:strand:+ start:5018 stop:6337 length:1320 start_codon:yes stop_codon:yes gene_type:complete